MHGTLLFVFSTNASAKMKNIGTAYLQKQKEYFGTFSLPKGSSRSTKFFTPSGAFSAMG